EHLLHRFDGAALDGFADRACGRGGTDQGGDPERCDQQQSRDSSHAVLRSGLAEEEDHEADEGQGLHEGDAQEHR
ncbi:MAG TPA: hypothetical protein DCS55_10660, partial [Acidimicrobiaceae bacterium]|nr:hypothetical protein [Acidimicrobiaceae bacterium]